MFSFSPDLPDGTSKTHRGSNLPGVSRQLVTVSLKPRTTDALSPALSALVGSCLHLPHFEVGPGHPIAGRRPPEPGRGDGSCGGVDGGGGGSREEEVFLP